MFLHLGADVMVYLNDIVAIISARQTAENPLKDLKNPLKIIQVSSQATKSLVLTRKAIYKSPISSSTLLKRAQSKKLVFEKPERRGKWAIKKHRKENKQVKL